MEVHMIVNQGTTSHHIEVCLGETNMEAVSGNTSDATARLSSPAAQLRCQGRFFGPWAALSQPRAS